MRGLTILVLNFLVVSSATARGPPPPPQQQQQLQQQQQHAQRSRGALFATRGGASLRVRKRSTARRYGLLKLEPSFISTFRLMVAAFFASFFNPFYLVDTSNSPTAGQGFFFPGSDGPSGSSSGGAGGSGSRNNNRKQGEKVQWYRNHNGERKQLKVTTLADLQSSSSGGGGGCGVGACGVGG